MAICDERVIAALLTNPTQKAAADAAGVHENTLTRLLQREDFQDQYRQARQALLTQTLERLQAINGRAVDCLEAVMSSAKSPASARVSAARTALEMSLRVIEIVDIGERLGAIERRLNGNDGAN